METQTRFDLNAAIADWQLELASQPELTPVVRRELETHLRDTITELQGRGLNNEESFWLARQRTGRPGQLGEEFAKGNPANAWKDRIFWLVVCLLFLNFWGTFINQFRVIDRAAIRDRVEDFLPGWVAFYLPVWLREMRTIYMSGLLFSLMNVAPVFLLAIFFANRRLKFEHRVLSFLVNSRARFIAVALGAFLTVNFSNFFKYGPDLLAYELPWVLSLIALAAWLIRPNKSAAVATA
jgi:hypothetical protein